MKKLQVLAFLPMLLLCNPSEVGAATLTMGNYTGPVATLSQGQFHNFPNSSQSAGVNSTVIVAHPGIGTPTSGDNGSALPHDNFINTGFGTFISLTLDPSESVASQSLTISPGAFDDGFRIDYNSTTILDFDYSDYSDNAAVRSMFGGASWAPWTFQGLATLEWSINGLQLFVMAQTDGTGAAEGVEAGEIINILDYFTPTTYVPNPGAPDFLNGASLALYNRNDEGAWAFFAPNMTARAQIIPEPSLPVLLGFFTGLGLLRRRRS
jgi:hypothetical protein